MRPRRPFASPTLPPTAPAPVLALVLAFALLFLGGCGNRGALYLPDKQPTTASLPADDDPGAPGGDEAADEVAADEDEEDG